MHSKSVSCLSPPQHTSHQHSNVNSYSLYIANWGNLSEAHPPASAARTARMQHTTRLRYSIYTQELLPQEPTTGALKPLIPLSSGYRIVNLQTYLQRSTSDLHSALNTRLQDRRSANAHIDGYYARAVQKAHQDHNVTPSTTTPPLSIPFPRALEKPSTPPRHHTHPRPTGKELVNRNATTILCIQAGRDF